MKFEKLVKYVIPLFAFAIVCRAAEVINFFYYIVPVLCLLFIVLFLLDSKFNLFGFGHNSEARKASSNLSAKGGFRPAYRTGRFAQHLPSDINHSLLIILLLPGIWFLLTSLWSSYPEISAARALYFILLSTGCVAAGFLWMQYSGKSVLDFLLPSNIIVVLICLFSIITGIPSDSWTGGNGKGFMGFFGHQNLLASVLLFTLPAVLYKIVILVRLYSRPRQGRAKSKIGYIESSDSRRTSFAGKTVKSDVSFRRSPESEIPSSYFRNTSYLLPLTSYSILFAFNLLLLILTYSRASLLALIIGVLVFLILNKNWRLLISGFVVVSILSLMVLFIPALNQQAEKIIKKDFPEFYSSRVWMWEPSYRAALDGGITGLGYGISDPKEKYGGLGDHFEGDRFVREKGNSTLALVEESGLIGLILFLFPIVYLYSKLKSKNELSKIDSKHYSLLILNSSLVAMLLHAQFEAWWVGVGSVQLPLFYIYLGLIVQGSRFDSSKFKV